MLPDKRAADAAPLADIGRCSPAAVDIIKRANPYKHGDGDLWPLQALDNSGKHQVLTTVAHGILAITSVATPESTRLLFPDSLTSPAGLATVMRMSKVAEAADGQAGAEGAVLSRIPSELRGKVDMDPQVTFDVAIHEPEIVEMRPLLRCLYGLLLVVDGIVEEFAAIPEG